MICLKKTYNLSSLTINWEEKVVIVEALIWKKLSCYIANRSSDGLGRNIIICIGSWMQLLLVTNLPKYR